jgi:cytidyltransferase-like protein
MKIVLVTGGFDPLHSGHIEYFKDAKKLGDKLIVGINSDEWLARKKGQPFMPIWERDQIIRELKVVDLTVMVADDPDNSCTTFIKETLALFPNDEIIFANGGDRTHLNIPEMSIKDPRLSFEFGVGGFNKSNSSSWILREWKQPKTLRQWGYYRILHDVPGTKVKELTVEPGKSLSLQRHKHRAEHWHISEGRCAVEQRMPNGYLLPIVELDTLSQIVIPTNDWHRLYNPFNVPCRIIEIQYGAECNEEDIERKE